MVVLVNDSGLQDSTIFRGKILTYYGRWTYKIEEAQRQGAAGILMVHTTESATYPWTTVLSRWVGPQVRLEVQPWFNYEGAVQQLRVIVRAALLIGTAREQPKWRSGSEFRAAGQKRTSVSTE